MSSSIKTMGLLSNSQSFLMVFCMSFGLALSPEMGKKVKGMGLFLNSRSLKYNLKALK